MKRVNYTISRLTAVVQSLSFMLLLLTPGVTLAEEVAHIYSVEGQVQVKRATSGEWISIEKGAGLADGDQVRTAESSRTAIRFIGGRMVRLSELSELKIRMPAEAKGSAGRMSLMQGVAHLFSRKSKNFPEIATPEVSAAIRGTEFAVETREGETTVTVFDGEVEMSNSAGSLRLAGGEQGSANSNSAPAKKLNVNPNDAVSWALHYPAVVDLSDYAGVINKADARYAGGWQSLVEGRFGEVERAFSGGAEVDRIGRALASAMQGRDRQALQQLQSGAFTKPEGLLLKANLLMRAGSIQKLDILEAEIQKAINAVDTSDRVRAGLLSHGAIRALLQNRRDVALDLAVQATQVDPDSANAAQSRAYVHQGRSELEAALKWIKKAQRLSPENSYILARHAELLLGFGDKKSSRALAERAVKVAPENNYARTVLGFIHLTQLDSEKAVAEFDRALAADSASGLTHLGRGLAVIRQGDLDLGRIELEKAVHLEPGTSQFRSYLGKLYFEQEDEELAHDEYGRAIELDSNDPTPYLYRAFNNLSRNRPVDALEDIENSIERNDNRAVFRSSLMLDQDLAVKGTSLSEVFSQIGFSRVAQLEAIKSINTDYTNYSAHRLLAESYEADFFADAQFTESIVSDLLAPLSFNVFSNLNGFSSDASLNEYSALFERPAQRTGISGSATTESDELNGNVFQTGVMDNFGYFLGYQTLYGDGRKSNGDYERQHRINLSTQYQATSDLRFLLNTGYTHSDDEQELFGSEVEDLEVALGLSYAPGSASELLMRFEYFDRSADSREDDVFQSMSIELLRDDETLSVVDTTAVVDSLSDEEFDSFRYAVQYIHEHELVSLIIGAEILDTGIDAASTGIILEDDSSFFVGPGTAVASDGSFDGTSYSSYAYTTWHAGSWAEIDLGINYTDLDLPQFDVIPPFDSGKRTDDQWSPKAGFSLYPCDDLTVRGAYFETIGIPSVDAIGSIEPTLVGSFNQVFGDLPGARAENYGVGVDYKQPSVAYFGVEYLYRDIDRDGIEGTQLFSIDTSDLTESSGSVDFMVMAETEREHIIKSYAYAVLGKDLTATVDYQRRELEAIDIDEHNDTDALRFGVNYFNTEYIFAFGRATWFHQELKNSFVYDDGVEAFWLFDAGVGYRIPRRSGAVRLVFQNILAQNFEFEDRGRQSPIDPDFNVRVEASVNF